MGSRMAAAIAKRSATAANVGYAAIETRIAYQVVPQISAHARYAATTAGGTRALWHPRRGSGTVEPMRKVLLLSLLALSVMAGCSGKDQDAPAERRPAKIATVSVD